MSPVSSAVPTPISTIVATAAPATATPIPTATPCSTDITPLVPVLVFQNGNLDIGVRYVLGSVSFFLAACRDIDAVRTKYGLGPAALVITQPGSEISTRYYRAAVPIGREPELVVMLASHTEDFQYVQFDVVSHPCLAGVGGACRVASSVVPRSGAAGTSFAMDFCCWPAGTRVTKTFTTPSGRAIVIDDVADSAETVHAGWAGDAADERGTYTVIVRDDAIASLLRFTVQ